jgi:hypothetical protein
MEAIKYEKKKRKTVLEPCNREETIYVMSFKYKGTIDGYYVYYVTSK